MSAATYIVGSALKVLATIPDDSIDLVVSSPPYLSLRSYLPDDDPAKADEMGSEATPADFLDALLDVTEELRRVLAPHGSICLELGDTYAGSGGAGRDYGPDGLQAGQPTFESHSKSRPISMSDVATASAAPPNRLRTRRQLAGWPLDKSLCMIPELYRIALAYGRNPLNGRPCSTWRCRNVIRHFRPNPPVGALGDKVRPATSEWIVACTSRTRYFDLDSVRTEQRTEHRKVILGKIDTRDAARSEVGLSSAKGNGDNNAAGAPPLDWWADADLEWADSAGFIAPVFGYPGAHYATFSPKVIRRLILPQCPRRVCTICGEPSRRIVDVDRVAEADDSTRIAKAGTYRLNSHDDPPEVGWEMRHTTLGWTDCGHDTWRPGMVLDPWAGSGVTGMVATGLGLDATLIDLDRRNPALAAERVGMFLTVIDPAEAVA